MHIHKCTSNQLYKENRKIMKIDKLTALSTSLEFESIINFRSPYYRTIKDQSLL